MTTISELTRAREPTTQLGPDHRLAARKLTAIAQHAEGPDRTAHAVELGDACASSLPEMAQAALTSPMWLNAWER